MAKRKKKDDPGVHDLLKKLLVKLHPELADKIDQIEVVEVGSGNTLTKDVDYQHPLACDDPIQPCCQRCDSLLLHPHGCACPDHIHQGAIVHSANCQCLDRFIPMDVIHEAPEVTWDVPAAWEEELRSQSGKVVGYCKTYGTGKLLDVPYTPHKVAPPQHSGVAPRLRDLLN